MQLGCYDQIFTNYGFITRSCHLKNAGNGNGISKIPLWLSLRPLRGPLSLKNKFIPHIGFSKNFRGYLWKCCRRARSSSPASFFPYKSYTFLQIQTVIKSHSLMPGCYFGHAFFHFWHSLSYTHNFMRCRSRDGLAKKSLATGIKKCIIPGIKDCINILTVRPNGLTSASPVETKTARLRMHRTEFRTISTTFLQLFDKGRLNEDVMMTYVLYLSHPFLIFSTFFHSWHSLRVRFFSPLVAKFSPKKCYF